MTEVFGGYQVRYTPPSGEPGGWLPGGDPGPLIIEFFAGHEEIDVIAIHFVGGETIEWTRERLIVPDGRLR